MSGSLGHTFIYNIIILFILIVFGFLAGTMSYYKAFKINNRIVSSIEKFEGYNSNDKTGGAIEEINRTLTTFGYSKEPITCPETYKDMTLVSGGDPFRYCIYIDSVKPSKNSYYKYGVLTYMNIDLPFISRLNLPVFTRTNRIYKFTNS